MKKIPLYYGLRFLSESIGGGLAHRVSGIFEKPVAMVTAAIVGAVPVAVIGMYKTLWLLPLYGLYYCIYAALGVQTETCIQNRMHGSHRATVLSVKSLFENLGGVLFILATGYIAKRWDFGVVWIVSGAFAACVSLLLLPMLPKQHWNR